MAGEVGLVLLALVLGRVFQLHPLARLDPGWSALLWGLGTTVPLLAGLFWVMRRPRGPLRDLTDLVVRQIGPMLAHRSVGELVLIAALAGVAEELLFRGVIQEGLTQLIPWPLALIAASTLFGLAHFASTTYALLAGAMGLYLGALYLVQGALLAPMITHALYDLVALLAVARRARVS